jgi:hypothetical protein
MARIWNTPIFILATMYFVVDGAFSYVTQPLSAWIAKKKLFERARVWVMSLQPYPSLALFRHPCHSAGAGQAFGGVFDRDRTFLRRGRYLHLRGSLEAYLRRAAVSVKSNETSIDPCVRVGISTLATHDGRR